MGLSANRMHRLPKVKLWWRYLKYRQEIKHSGRSTGEFDTFSLILFAGSEFRNQRMKYILHCKNYV